MPDRIPTPRSYVEIEHRIVWPTSTDAAEIIRAGLALDDDDLDEKQKTGIVEHMLGLRDWAVVVIAFEARNVYGATLALNAHCIVSPLYGATAPTPTIGEIPDPLRCTFKSLCGRP